MDLRAGASPSDDDEARRLYERLELLAAIDVALTVLGSDGPLDPPKLSRVMVTVHTRFVDLIRETARELGELDADEWRTVAEGSAENFRSLVEALSGDLRLDDRDAN